MIASRTPQGVRGLKLCHGRATAFSPMSHSARSAWIETVATIWNPLRLTVALRKECVD